MGQLDTSWPTVVLIIFPEKQGPLSQAFVLAAHFNGLAGDPHSADILAVAL
jgi:hypothetical protein